MSIDQKEPLSEKRNQGSLFCLVLTWMIAAVILFSGLAIPVDADTVISSDPVQPMPPNNTGANGQTGAFRQTEFHFYAAWMDGDMNLKNWPETEVLTIEVRRRTAGQGTGNGTQAGAEGSDPFLLVLQGSVQNQSTVWQVVDSSDFAELDEERIRQVSIDCVQNEYQVYSVTVSGLPFSVTAGGAAGKTWIYYAAAKENRKTNYVPAYADSDAEGDPWSFVWHGQEDTIQSYGVVAQIEMYSTVSFSLEWYEADGEEPVEWPMDAEETPLKTDVQIIGIAQGGTEIKREFHLLPDSAEEIHGYDIACDLEAPVDVYRYTYTIYGLLPLRYTVTEENVPEGYAVKYLDENGQEIVPDNEEEPPHTGNGGTIQNRITAETNPEGTSGGTTPGGTNPEGTSGGTTPDGTTPGGTDPEGTSGGTTPDGTDPEGTSGGTNPEGTSGGTTPDGTDPEGTSGGTTPGGTNPEGTSGGTTHGGTTSDGSDPEGSSDGTMSGDTTSDGTDPEGTSGGTTPGGTTSDGSDPKGSSDGTMSGEMTSDGTDPEEGKNTPKEPEEEEPSSTPTPTQEITPAPTEEPTAVPPQETTPGPTDEPTAIPPRETAPEPTAEPTPVPTAVTTEMVSPVPTVSAGITATPTPKATATPAPTASSASVSVTVTGSGQSGSSAAEENAWSRQLARSVLLEILNPTVDISRLESSVLMEILNVFPDTGNMEISQISRSVLMEILNSSDVEDTSETGTVQK